MVDQPSSLLTAGQRKVLTGEKEPSRKRTMQSRIRRRVYTGLRTDGVLLLDRLDAEERRKIFREWENDWQDEQLEPFPGRMVTAGEMMHETDTPFPDEKSIIEQGYFRNGLVNLLAFLYLGIHEGNVGEFNDILEKALQRAAKAQGQYLAEFTFNEEMKKPQPLSPEEIADRVRADDGDLTVSEIKRAFEEGAVTQADIEEYFEESWISNMVQSSILPESSEDVDGDE